MFGSFIYCPCSFFIWLFFIQSSICRLSCGIRAKRISWKFHKARGDPYHTEFNSYWANNFYFVFHMRGGAVALFCFRFKKISYPNFFLKQHFFLLKILSGTKTFFQNPNFFQTQNVFGCIIFSDKNFVGSNFFLFLFWPKYVPRPKIV